MQCIKGREGNCGAMVIRLGDSCTGMPGAVLFLARLVAVETSRHQVPAPPWTWQSQTHLICVLAWTPKTE